MAEKEKIYWGNGIRYEFKDDCVLTKFWFDEPQAYTGEGKDGPFNLLKQRKYNKEFDFYTIEFDDLYYQNRLIYAIRKQNPRGDLTFLFSSEQKAIDFNNAAKQYLKERKNLLEIISFSKKEAEQIFSDVSNVSDMFHEHVDFSTMPIKNYLYYCNLFNRIEKLFWDFRHDNTQKKIANQDIKNIQKIIKKQTKSLG